MKKRILFNALIGGLTALLLTPVESKADVELLQVVDVIQPGGAYNLITDDLPRAITVRELGLVEAGLTGGMHFLDSDEIRVFANKDLMQQSPLARFWISRREGGRLLFHTGGQGPGDDFMLQPGYVIVVITRVSTQPISWVNPFVGAAEPDDL